MRTPETYAAGIPVSDPTPVTTYSPVLLPVPGRATDLAIKVSAPATGSDLPVIVLSHGHGPSTFLSSSNGYGPVAGFWAAHGFVVVQPTHQDSKTLDLDPHGPEGALFWRSRAEDVSHVLDHLEQIEATVPGLAGRLDRRRVAAVGHSMGGHTVGLLAGMRTTDPVDGTTPDLTDPRITASVMMAPPGKGEDLAEWGTEHYPALGTTDFAQMTAPVLVVVGEEDAHPFFSERKDWRSDAYLTSPGPKTRLVLFGAEHGLGGVSGFDVAETTDEDPERVAALRALVWAYLRTQLYPGDTAWTQAVAALESSPVPLGRVDVK